MAKTEQAAVCDGEAADLVGRERLREYLKQMQLIRRFEERAAREYAAGRISGFCHLYIGQEGVAVGALGALEARDHVVTAYRDHGHALLRGCSARGVMAELMGKVTGVARGRGGSMHMFNAEERFHGGHGIVGGHIPLATGFAFASAYEQKGDVSICFFGEGAMNQGAFYESLNLASLWKLPAIYVIENNQYAMGTPLSRASAISDLASKASAFGMEGEVVDGMDVTLVHACIARAAKRAREERRPTLIEARCYRFRGHSMSDPAKYRTKDEVDERKEHDPISLATNTLLQREWASADEIEAWDAEAKETAADASEFAIDSPQPSVSDLGRYVYAEPLGWTPDEAMTPHVRTEE
ncbi:MAG: pyruvate dehydrogenase (acetyl-transferring) E1 component subunit alpha [Myxococcota bacterium]